MAFFVFNNINLFLSFETSDGTQREESARVNDLGSDHEEIVINGRYSYFGDDGKNYALSFQADKDGFRPSADYLPQ